MRSLQWIKEVLMSSKIRNAEATDDPSHQQSQNPISLHQLSDWRPVLCNRDETDNGNIHGNRLGSHYLIYLKGSQL
jgi:hypothetical protein